MGQLSSYKSMVAWKLCCEGIPCRSRQTLWWHCMDWRRQGV